jgi:hypothetical protein
MLKRSPAGTYVCIFVLLLSAIFAVYQRSRLISARESAALRSAARATRGEPGGAEPRTGESTAAPAAITSEAPPKADPSGNTAESVPAKRVKIDFKAAWGKDNPGHLSPARLALIRNAQVSYGPFLDTLRLTGNERYELLNYLADYENAWIAGRLNAKNEGGDPVNNLELYRLFIEAAHADSVESIKRVLGDNYAAFEHWMHTDLSRPAANQALALSRTTEQKGEPLSEAQMQALTSLIAANVPAEYRAAGYPLEVLTALPVSDQVYASAAVFLSPKQLQVLQGMVKK